MFLCFLSILLQRMEAVRAGRLAQPSKMCFAMPRPTHRDMEGELLSTGTRWLPSLPCPSPSHPGALQDCPCQPGLQGPHFSMPAPCPCLLAPGLAVKFRIQLF